MYILAIETTGPELSVAVINDRGEIVELSSKDRFSHLQNLVPMIEELLKSTGLSLSDAAAIAVSVGPGSFTGIRIGVSTARALAQALGLKAIAVPTLKSFAYHAEDYMGVICPIFDARRGQVYAGAYVWNETETGKKEILEVVRGGAYELSEFLGYLNQGMKMYGLEEIMLFGDGVPVYGEKVAEWAAVKGINFYDAKLLLNLKDIGGAMRPAAELQVASSVAKYALELYDRGMCCEYGELEPEYMRKSEAERRLEEGTLGKKKS